MRFASQWLVPGHRHGVVQVRSGLGRGLVFDLYPRWEQAVWEGEYESQVQQVLAEVLRPGTVFYDVGGGMGFYSCCAARVGAEVFVFEPDEKNAAWLQAHVEMNGLS